MLNSPLPAPILLAGTAASAIFIIDGVLMPMPKPITHTTAITIHSGVLTSMLRKSTVPSRLATMATMHTRRGSMRSMSLPATGALSRPLPYRNRVTKPNCAAVPPGRVLMKKASEYTMPLEKIMCSQ